MDTGRPMRVIEAGVVVLAVTQILIYLRIVALTIGYPYPLEWMEGGSIDVIGRVLEGLPIYTKPTADYVPYVYPPFYYVVGAGVAKTIGLGFLAGRLVSFGAICATSALVWLFIRREGGGRVAALAGIGLLAAAFDYTDRVLHLARVDSLFVFLLFAGWFVWRFVPGTRGAIFAAVLFWLAFITKQTTAMILAFACPVLLLAGVRRALVFAIASAVLIALTTLAMDWSTGGWWSYFIFTLPAAHEWLPRMIRWFVRYDIGPVVPIACLCAAWLIVTLWTQERERAATYTALVFSAVGACWLSRIHSGGALNVLLPAFVALAIACPMVVGALRHQPTARVLATVAVGAQLAWLTHLPAHAVPTSADRAAGDAYVRFLADRPGEVLIWHQRFVATRAGKRSWGLEMAAEDILRSRDSEMATALKADVIAAFAKDPTLSAVDPPDWVRDVVGFGTPVELFPNLEVFRPIAGAPKRPMVYYHRVF